MKEELKEYIFGKLEKLAEKDRSIISSLICDEMNLDRCKFIISKIFSLSLDNNAVKSFLSYQKYKVFKEQE